VLRALSRLFALIAAVQILGGHWAVLQTLAWTGMLIENVQRKPITEALARTFDGSQPCGLCKVVTEGRKSEEKQDLAKLVVKLDAVLAPAAALPPRAEAATGFPALVVSDCSHSDSPLTRPPIG
jgi:hypothetical protein